jgi:hypothetical protein
VGIDVRFDAAAFERIQRGLGPFWPDMTLRRRSGERTLIVLSSVSLAVPAHLGPLLPAYEERYLSFVLTLAQAPLTTVVYITSQPMLPRLLEYYLELIPGVDAEDVRRRLITVSVGDGSPRPLAEKVLERPRLIERLRRMVVDPNRAVILPFVVTELEARLAVELGVPIYGPHPQLGHLGTKSGSRQMFRAAAVPHPRGTDRIDSVGAIVEFLADIGRHDPAKGAIVKHDGAVSGLGNAVVDLDGADDRAEIERRVRRLRPEDESLSTEEFLARFESVGGIVEERIDGDDFRSPSVQLRASPEGDVEVLSTHDQVLGGPSGQTYFGCRFPADAQYAAQMSEHGIAIGEQLVKEGVMGRFAVDFVATRDGDGWQTHAVEINLRNGGTTHPYSALLALTEGVYDTARAEFVADGTAKHYVATDHLETPGLRTLTPDDVLDVVCEAGLGWDHSELKGLVFHMLSGVAVAGRVGVTAIANSADDAQQLYESAEAALRAAAVP